MAKNEEQPSSVFIELIFCIDFWWSQKPDFRDPINHYIALKMKCVLRFEIRVQIIVKREIKYCGNLFLHIVSKMSQNN